MLLSSAGTAVAPPGSGPPHTIPSMQGQPWAAPALAPALNAAPVLPQQPSAAMAWLAATAAPASSAVRPPLPFARTAATQTWVALGTTPQLLPPPQPEPHRPNEDHQSLASAAAVAASPSSSAASMCPAEEDAQSLPPPVPPMQHPVLLMARVHEGSAVALDDVHLEGPCTASRQRQQQQQQQQEAAPPARRSDTFIGHRVSPVPDEKAWAQASIILNESPLVTTRPTTDQLLDAHLLSAKPLPRAQQWGLGRREQDRALAELKQALAGPPPKRQGNYHRGPRPNKEKAAEEQAAGGAVADVGKAGSQPEQAQPEEPEQEGAAGGSSTTSAAAAATTREQDDDGGSSVVSADGASRGEGGGGGQRRGVKRGREQDGGNSSTTTTTTTTTTSSSSGGGAGGAKAKAPAGRARSEGPKIEVLEDDTILVDGAAVCAPTDKYYASLFGLASMEKHRDPEWHIANGIVDRCYYRGSKKKAKTRPGVDYFPTDQAMMADFVRRKPDVFIAQVLNA